MEQSSLDTFQNLFTHAANVVLQNLVKTYRLACMGQHNEILISQAQAVLLNE